MPTTLGRHLVNGIIPEKFRTNDQLTKSGINQLLVNVAKEDPKKYPEVVSKLKRFGDEMSTLEGISVGLDDIAPDTEARDKVLGPHVEAFKKAKTSTEKEKALHAGFVSMMDLAKKHPGTMGEMVRAGGRGNAAQLLRAVGAPVHVNDVKGKVIPWLIDRSFSEGLKPAQAWVAGSEARVNEIITRTSVVEPGDLSKILINNTGDQIISVIDCKTKNGLMMQATDPHIIDRYLVSPHELITPQMASKIAAAGKPVLVRSPMTCEAHQGICQHCQGLSPSGTLHPVGTNVGVRAAQALAEPLTQFTLNAKHGGRVANVDDAKRLEGVKGVRALIEIPESFTHKATLATKDGTVSHVNAAPQGGFHVFVSGESHYVPPSYTVAVKPGQTVYAGDALSDGVPKPDEIVHYKGMGEGRKYLVDTMADVYKRAGSEIDKRHLETLAKSVINHVQIVDPGPGDAFMKGEVVNYNKFHAALAASKKNMALHDAIGETLGDDVLHHTAGTTITAPMVDQLSKYGIKTVPVASQGPRAIPIMESASRNPLLNPDWMSRLAHRYLKETLLTGIHRGDVSNLHGAHPVPGYVAGSEFGLGQDGGY